MTFTSVELDLKLCHAGVRFYSGSGIIVETLSDTSGIWEEAVKLFEGDSGI